MDKKGILMIISGPSGSGKGTIVNELIKEENYYLSVSATTRLPRINETEGIHYFFKERKEFEKLIEAEELLEWAEFCGNFYGTPKSNVENKLMEGKNVILEIEVQGALKIKQLYPDCVLIFVIPPSIDELKKRLVQRGTEKEEVIQRRIARALEEIEIMKEYDYVVINDDLLTAVENINTIVKAEKLKVTRNSSILKQIRGDEF